MLPNFIFSTYKQNTADLDAIAGWLAKTAAISGYPKNLRPIQAALEQKSFRLKGKARKLAQQASVGNPSDNKNRDLKPSLVPETPKYLISIGDLLPLAEWIVKPTKPSLEVPASFILVLERAIQQRSYHHRWWYYYGEHSGKLLDCDKPAKESHGYLIGVLEKIRDILLPKMSQDLLKDPFLQSVEQAHTSKETTNDHTVNMFENPNTDELSEAFLNPESISAGQKPSTIPQFEYCLSRNLDLSEVDFALHGLFHDFDRIREYLQQVWEGYKQGEYDLVAASITTNTAVDFARDIHEEFIVAFPAQSDFKRHIRNVYGKLCMNADRDPCFRNRPDDELNFEAYEDIEPTLFPTRLIIECFNRIFPESYKPKSRREWKLPKWKFREDKALLLENLSDFYILAQAEQNIPAEDELTRGIREMIKGDQIPIWLVFAAQIYLDIHHILRKDVSKGFHDLVKSARYVEENIQQILRFHQNLHMAEWPKSNNESLFRILDVIKNWVNLDAMENARTKLGRNLIDLESPSEPFLFLKNHPWYCGLLSYYIKASTQEISITFVNACGSILRSAHLYNALRQERLVETAWPDMGLAVLIHKPENVFGGDFTKTAAGYFKRFSIVLKCSARNVATNRRRGKTVTSQSGPGKFNQLPLVFRMFKNRFCCGENRTNLSVDNVYTILDGEKSNEEKAAKMRISMQPPVSDSRPTEIQVSATPGLEPMQILHALLNALQSERLELTFDHFRLHEFCWNMLGQLRETLSDDLLELYGRGCLMKENQLPLLVGYILMAGSNQSSLEGVLVPKKKDEVTDQLLIKAAKVVKRMLKNGAGQSEFETLKELGIVVEAPDFWNLEGSQRQRQEQ